MTQTIDFRHRGWGHNLTINATGPGTYTGWCWSTPGPRVGDRIIWATEYGHAVAELTECRWARNVDDMYEISARIIERWTPDGMVLPDQPGGS